MNDLLRLYLEALPGSWLMDTGRYVVAASAMAAILSIGGTALARRKLQSRRATGRDIRREILAAAVDAISRRRATRS